MNKNFKKLMCIVKDMQNKTVVIVAAHSSMVIDAAVNAKIENIAESFFIGDKLFIIKY